MEKRIKYMLIGSGVCVIVAALASPASAASRDNAVVPPGGNFADAFVNFSRAAFAYSTAAALGVPAERFYGVMAAESGGKPYSDVGAVVIRFEPHVFLRRSGATVLLPGMSAPTSEEGRRRHGGQAAEWDAFRRAWEINPEAAAASTSYGVGQIMGFNFGTTGYPSAVAMYNDVVQRPMAQFDVFVNFIRNSPRIYSALAAGDYPTFVRYYNGAAVGSAANDDYVSRMLAAQQQFTSGQVA